MGRTPNKDEIERIKRWRLILGSESKERFEAMNRQEGLSLTEEQVLMDQALAAIYNRSESGGFGSGKGAGNGPSNPQVSRWLGDVRTLFDKDLVTVIQSDAIERCGLRQMLFEPELLEAVEPDLNLASTLL